MESLKVQGPQIRNFQKLCVFDSRAGVEDWGAASQSKCLRNCEGGKLSGFLAGD